MHRNFLATLLIAAASIAAACASDAPTPVNAVADLLEDVQVATSVPSGSSGSFDTIDLEVLSGDSTRITGNNALLRIGGASLNATMQLNGKDVTGDFERNANGDYVGLVRGMGVGNNSFVVVSDDFTFTETLTNFASRGPVFSGPHIEPFVCTTETYGLGAPLDGDCSAATRVFWTYLDTAGELQPLADPTVSPADAATVSANDQLVPAIIRNEVGTINRGIYWIHVLDPDPGEASAATWAGTAWNERLVFRYGSGCGSTYSQGDVTIPNRSNALGGPVDIDLLSVGYALAYSTFTTMATHCNDVLAAETTMMVKEHFIERYGRPELTIGQGDGTGATAQFLIAQNYPGLLDAISASRPLPDVITTIGNALDCTLLNRFYAGEAGAGFTPAQQTAINGHAGPGTCNQWADQFGPLIDATTGCHPGLDGFAYDPEDNRTGLRCTFTDANPAIWGLDDRGVANRPLDNAGIQYGLRALNDGIITPEQFITLNRELGSLRIDGQPTERRASAEPEDIEAAFENGRVNQAGGDLRRVPIVLIDVYTDRAGDPYDRSQVFTVLERVGGGGTAPPGNVAVWTDDRGITTADDLAAYNARTTDLRPGQDTSLVVESIRVLDEWATEVAADQGDDSLTLKLVNNRPVRAANLCVAPDGTQSAGEAANQLNGPCGFQLLADPRQIAGNSANSLAVKCALRPLDFTSYAVL
ncbi:MAG: hypothetical protein HKN26_09650, partial [Acidimicrobiales bacterium]|nr:hypothetical protein [Acidimicrobiales bacterium]